MRHRGTKRSGRIGITDLSSVLEDMHHARNTAVRIQTKYPIRSEAYKCAVRLSDCLEKLSKALTGDPHAHWSNKPDMHTQETSDIETDD